MTQIEILLAFSCSITTGALLITIFYGVPLWQSLPTPKIKSEPYYKINNLNQVAYEKERIPLVGNLDMPLFLSHSPCYPKKAIPFSFCLSLSLLTKSWTLNPYFRKAVKLSFSPQL